MDRESGVSKECRGNGRDGDRGFSKVEYRDYDPSTDRTSLAIMFKDYWRHVSSGEDLDRYIELKSSTTGHSYRMNRIDGEIDSYIYNDGCKIKVAEKDQRLIGFMIYHYVFECILIVRAIYFVTEYRKSALLHRLPLSVGYVSKVISQTDKKSPPKEIVGEKPRREHVFEGPNFDVWINTVNRGRSPKWLKNKEQFKKQDGEERLQKSLPRQKQLRSMLATPKALKDALEGF